MFNIMALCGRKLPYGELITYKGIILPSLRVSSVGWSVLPGSTEAVPVHGLGRALDPRPPNPVLPGSISMLTSVISFIPLSNSLIPYSSVFSSYLTHPSVS